MKTMRYYRLLARMAEIQAEIQEICNEDGFVALDQRRIQVTSEMFHFLFPDNGHDGRTFDGFTHMCGRIGDLLIISVEPAEEASDEAGNP